MSALPWHHRWNVLALTILAQTIVVGMQYCFLRLESRYGHRHLRSRRIDWRVSHAANRNDHARLLLMAFAMSAFNKQTALAATPAR